MASQPLQGVPVREGTLWRVLGCEQLELVTLRVYVSGISLVYSDREREELCLSPFSIIGPCDVVYDTIGSATLKPFKLGPLSCGDEDINLAFCVQGDEEAKLVEERSEWLSAIANSVRMVTQSLFPPFCISCRPLCSVPSTSRRIMAGYLVHNDGEGFASVVYAELHPQLGKVAQLVLYENELCDPVVTSVPIGEGSRLGEKVGFQCSCFMLEGHTFSTRTLWELRLWMRALSNIKVKLLHAPDPSPEDLENYRKAVKEGLRELRKALPLVVHKTALLKRNPRRFYFETSDGSLCWLKSSRDEGAGKECGDADDGAGGGAGSLEAVRITPCGGQSVFLVGGVTTTLSV
eukprot:NODE_10106_length_1376_cov_4.447558.p1 GENE.NODE_10106_length_1376_cov_4.447558~~NODE_10106_length_1376_cov_4.447558.p1  ORF type:complete len:357 (-),score=78.44 NODE_10106_length_1376_cov_4.447558:305-1348(-)